MKNKLLIELTQLFPSWLGARLRGLKSLRGAQEVQRLNYLEDVDHFKTEHLKEKRALVMLYPSAWLTAVNQYPHIKLYNHSGFVFSLVKALNESGYLVDLADPHHPLELKKKYDLFIGHGGSCKGFIEQLPEDVPIYQYISGLYWKVFERESDERYARFFDKHGGVKPTEHKRDIKAMVEGLEYLNEKADVLFSINCPRMVAAYGRYSNKFFFTGLGAYPDDLFRIPLSEKNFDLGRKNFVYVGGTSGNLQKGLDLLLEAFNQTPDLHLYIYCKVEEEILRYSKKELAAHNIHYIYHWKYKPYHGQLKALLRQMNFTVHAPINIGMDTAFMATMGVGMIPVGYVDVPEPVGESAVLVDTWQVDALVDCIKEASQKSPKWCQDASVLSIEKYNEHCEPNKVEENFKAMLTQVS